MGKACPVDTSADFFWLLYRHIFPKSLVHNSIFIAALRLKQNFFGQARAYLSCAEEFLVNTTIQPGTAVSSTAASLPDASLGNFLLANGATNAAGPDFKTVAATFFAGSANVLAAKGIATQVSQTPTKLAAAIPFREHAPAKSNTASSATTPPPLLASVPATNLQAQVSQVVNQHQSPAMTLQLSDEPEGPTASTAIFAPDALHQLEPSNQVPSSLVRISQEESLQSNAPLIQPPYSDPIKIAGPSKLLDPKLTGGSLPSKPVTPPPQDFQPRPGAATLSPLAPIELATTSVESNRFVPTTSTETQSSELAASATVSAGPSAQMASQFTAPLMKQIPKTVGSDVRFAANHLTVTPDEKPGASLLAPAAVGQGAKNIATPNFTNAAPSFKDTAPARQPQPNNTASQEPPSLSPNGGQAAQTSAAPPLLFVSDLSQMAVPATPSSAGKAAPQMPNAPAIRPMPDHPMQFDVAKPTVTTAELTTPSVTPEISAKLPTAATQPANSMAVAPNQKTDPARNRTEPTAKGKVQRNNVDEQTASSSSSTAVHPQPTHPIEAPVATADAASKANQPNVSTAAGSGVHGKQAPSKDPAPQHLASSAATNAPEGDEAIPAATQPLVNTAKLIQGISQSELRVGMQSREFGNIDIRTSVAHHEFSAQISVEHNDVAKTMAMELPGLYDRLNEQNVSVNHIVIQNNSLATSSGLAQHQQQSTSKAQTSGTAKSALEPILPVIPEVATGTGRLDVRF
jgi:hypothetical protein